MTIRDGQTLYLRATSVFFVSRWLALVQTKGPALTGSTTTESQSRRYRESVLTLATPDSSHELIAQERR